MLRDGDVMRAPLDYRRQSHVATRLPGHLVTVSTKQYRSDKER